MQFQVPQFIEVEDKIFGPLTFKQFLYLAGGGGLVFILWQFLPLVIAAPLMATVAGISLGLAFFQYNKRPLVLALESGFYYLIRNKLYLWDTERKRKVKKDAKKAADEREAEVPIPTLSSNKLHELAWSLDIKERLGEIEARNMPTPLGSDMQNKMSQ